MLLYFKLDLAHEIMHVHLQVRNGSTADRSDPQS